MSIIISMGNPHAVVYPEEFGWDEDPEHLELESWGPLFERHLGEKRVNTEFLRVLDRKTMELRVWERGSGETLACGTGACAAAVSSILRNLTDREVRIKLKGGNLLVKWGEDGESLYMTGPAVTVFKGRHYCIEKEKSVMFKLNDNYLKLPGSYLFSTIGKKVAAYSKEHRRNPLSVWGSGM